MSLWFTKDKCNMSCIYILMWFFLIFYSVEQLVKLFSLMDPNSPERVAFVSRALKWSTGGSGKLGHPKLHQLLAVTLWKGIFKLCAFSGYLLHQIHCANFLSVFRFVQNKTTASLATISCTPQTARAVLRCWWSTRPLAAFAAKSTCLWPRPSYSKCTSAPAGEL